MKFLKIMLIVVCILMGCEKADEPDGPGEPPVDDHEQGKVEN